MDVGCVPPTLFTPAPMCRADWLACIDGFRLSQRPRDAQLYSDVNNERVSGM